MCPNRFAKKVAVNGLIKREPLWVIYGFKKVVEKES